MDQTTDNLKPIPRFRWRKLLTPWRWSRWTWALVVPLMLVAYFVSAVPVQRFALQRALQRQDSAIAYVIASLAYRPVMLLIVNSPPAFEFAQWQHGLMDLILGPIPIASTPAVVPTAIPNE